MKQKTFYLKTVDAILVIDTWLATKPMFYWGKQPDEVKNEILEKSENGFIKHQELTMILASAETSKLIGFANKGMEKIKNDWNFSKFATQDCD